MEKFQTPCLLLDMTSYTQIVIHNLRNGELLLLLLLLVLLPLLLLLLI
jgi:hypothetical protein